MKNKKREKRIREKICVVSFCSSFLSDNNLPHSLYAVPWMVIPHFSDGSGIEYQLNIESKRLYRMGMGSFQRSILYVSANRYSRTFIASRRPKIHPCIVNTKNLKWPRLNCIIWIWNSELTQTRVSFELLCQVVYCYRYFTIICLRIQCTDL